MAYFEVVSDVALGQVVSLRDGVLLVGRDEDCDLCLNDGRISRHHARFVEQQGQVRVEDLESKNGLLVNGVRVQSVTLQEGDEIAIGPLVMRYHADSPPPPQSRVMDLDAATRLMDMQGPTESQRRLGLVLEIASALDALDDPDKALSLLGELLRKLLRPTAAAVRIGDDVYSFGGATGSPAAVESQAVPEVIDAVRSRGEAMLVSAPQWRSSAMLAGRALVKVRSAMAAPISFQGTRVGYAYCESELGHGPAFTDDDLLLLGGVCRLVGAALANAQRMERIAAHNRSLQDTSSSLIVGRSRAVVELRTLIEKRIGPARAGVLIEGETGTGKTLVAQAIHLASPRAGGPFIKINCASIPRELVESELFGYEKGAFSGAGKRKLGLFEIASGGTLLLDEVAELEPAAQAKVLAAIQDREILRVGGTSRIAVDVRLLAATNKDLEAAVNRGEFRSDLFFRLNVVRITIPPLRERAEDVELLAAHFLENACRLEGRPFVGMSLPVVEALRRYPFPGNVRELQNAMERAVVFAEPGRPLMLEDLPEEIAAFRPTSIAFEAAGLSEEQAVRAAMDEARGNKRLAARLLGWYPQKLYDRLKRYGIGP